MDDIRRNAEKRASIPNTTPIGESFESERKKQKAALVRQLDELDSSRVRKISAYTETDEYEYPDEFEEDTSNSLKEAEEEEEEVYDIAEDDQRFVYIQDSVPSFRNSSGATNRKESWKDFEALWNVVLPNSDHLMFIAVKALGSSQK